MSRASYRKDFVVAPTIGKAAEGEDSLLSLNNIIQSATTTSEVLIPMKRICAAAAMQRKLLLPNMSKCRGDPDDFLTFCAMNYTERWKKQYDGKMAPPAKPIQNWIPYILSTIRFHLIEFNKQVYDYDILPLPRYWDEDDEGEVSQDKDIPDEHQPDIDLFITLKELADRETLLQVLLSLPEEFYPYLIDILYYIRTKGTLITKDVRNFVLVGYRLFYEELEDWIT